MENKDYINTYGKSISKLFFKTYRPFVIAKQLKIILSYFNEILGSFAETTGQNHTQLKHAQRTELWPESKEQDPTRTWTPEHFQKHSVCSPGRSCDDISHHKQPSSKILQLKLTPPMLPHTCCRTLFKTDSKTWIGRVQVLEDWLSILSSGAICNKIANYFFITILGVPCLAPLVPDVTNFLFCNKNGDYKGT